MDGVILDTANIDLAYLQQAYRDFTREDYERTLNQNWSNGVKEYQNRQKYLNESEDLDMKDKCHPDKESIGVFPGISEALEELARDGYLIALNTSASDRNTMMPLDKAGILPYFDWAGTCETSFSKVDKFKMIQEKFSLSNKDCLFFTDTIGDLAEAHKAGIATIGVSWGLRHKAFFEKVDYDNLIKVIDNPDKIVDTVQAFFNHGT